MSRDIIFEKVAAQYIQNALNLSVRQYEREKSFNPVLPEFDSYDQLEQLIATLFEKGTGLVGIQNGQVVAYIAGFKVENIFGNVAGVYCPIYGHGLSAECHRKILVQLYSNVSDVWVKQELLTHAMTLYSHENDVSDYLFWQGFGRRCSDAIRKVKLLSTDDNSVIVKKTHPSMYEMLANLHRLSNEYYRTAPIFMPNQDKDPIREQIEWNRLENHHEFIAFRDYEPIGMMRLSPNAETFISDHPSVMNIQMTYIVESERNNAVGKLLLSTTQEWLLKHGYCLCGVDFETLNPLASAFWMKYFSPYTYSLVRRIDERIIDVMK